MKFRIKKQLNQGKFYVYVQIEEFSPADQAKSIKFGMPTLTVRNTGGMQVNVSVNSLASLVPFGFASQAEADQYADNLKVQIVKLKERWDSFEDVWSKDELI